MLIIRDRIATAVTAMHRVDAMNRRIPRMNLLSAGLLAVLMMPSLAAAGERLVTGSVTYLAAGTVYTSIGKDTGIQDSSRVFVLEGRDTIAVLQVTARSSKSTACRILSGTRAVRVRDRVAVVIVTRDAPAAQATATPSGDAPTVTLTTRPVKPPVPASWIEVKGRVSTQMFMTRYDNSAFNIAQPGIVLNFRGKGTTVPVVFEMYSNLRLQSRGSAALFGREAVNESRVYRIAAGYDDGTTTFLVGRMTPLPVPSIGTIDGGVLSHKFGHLTVGTAVGFQPSYTYRGIATDYKKGSFFVSYETEGKRPQILGLSYTRTYFRSILDREVAGASVNLGWWDRISVYGNAEMDIRRKSGDALIVSPALSMMYVNMYYRLTRVLSVGVGADASRPQYSYATILSVPDSLLDTRLRGGTNLNINVSLPYGIMFTNTYAPRVGDADFGNEYADYASLAFNDIASSGMSLRSNVNFNESAFTNALGYGVTLQQNVFNLADISLRYQKTRYTIKRVEQRDNSTTYGGDLIIPLTRALVLSASYDRFEGYGISSNTFFGEFSVRF